MSATLEVPGNNWGGQDRICTWARFHGNPRFAVFNTHLESDAPEARQRSVALLPAKVKEPAGAGAVFLIGDFNFKQNSPEYRQLARQLRDGYRGPSGGRSDRVSSHSFTCRKRNLLWR